MATTPWSQFGERTGVAFTQTVPSSRPSELESSESTSLQSSVTVANNNTGAKLHHHQNKPDHPSPHPGASNLAQATKSTVSMNNSQEGTGCVQVAPADPVSADTMSVKESFSAAVMTEPAHIPRRNLSEAFEELYIAPPAAPTATDNANVVTPGVKPLADGSKLNLISPTGVADLYVSGQGTRSPNGMVPLPVEEPAKHLESKAKSETSFPFPFFHLHPDLKRDLSQAVINRVSFYGVVHDINKEASAMAANDDSAFNRTTEASQQSEDSSSLVVAVNGPPASTQPTAGSAHVVVSAALIDEERWLLSAIETRGQDENRPVQACPPTFLQAMGEREYENPLTALSNGSRTQLWKPSRSWWEAKSGKNPWIEPKSHNKRWRYLWPLIHYHKFLAKCIKKLKRNGVDVKMSVSPVAAFLREEVCAVSDHLAAVSLFDSDVWMSCLKHFSGWTDTSDESEARLRPLVSKLQLRTLAEPGDVESPLLRSQIDEQFLRSMVAARSQMELGGDQQERRKQTKAAPRTHNHSRRDGTTPQDAADVVASQMQSSRSCPPMYPRQNSMSPYQVPNQVGEPPRVAAGARRPRVGYPYPCQWWGQGWAQTPQYHFGDDASNHSSLSGDAFSEYGMYPGPPPNGLYYAPPFHHQVCPEHAQSSGMFDPHMSDPHNMYPMYDPYHPENAGLGWVGHPAVDPNMPYGMQQHADMAGYYGMPAAPCSPQDSSSPHIHQADPRCGQVDFNTTRPMEGDQTPYKYDPSKTPLSPFWAHLDRATMAMGLATPQTNPAKTTMSNEAFPAGEQAASFAQDPDNSCTGNAQPLLLRQSQVYGYGPYGPPSPATQFMMSPQASFAYNYGYGYSPTGNGCEASMPGHGGKKTPSKGGRFSAFKQAAPGLSPSGRRKGSPEADRESPSTVETIAESESHSESA